jgi:HEAT repeat protein
VEKRDIKGLIKALDHEKDILIRYRSAEALGEFGGKLAVEPLIKTLNDNDGDVRSIAVFALGQLGDKEHLKL